MLATRNLTYAYPGASALRLPDLDLGDGEQALLLGPSGSGKSTLLALLAGLLTPSGGTVEIAGTAVHALRGRRRDHWRGRAIGLVYQRPRLLPTQTVRANVVLPLRLLGRPLPPDGGTATLHSLGLAHLAARLPQACSLGEQQRVGILRALVHAPALILADEPTSALDRDNALAVAQLLTQEARARSAMLLVVTHDARIAPLFSRTVTLAHP